VTAANPLIAARVDTTSAWAGIYLVEDIEGLVHGIQSGSWIESGLGALGTGLDALSFVVDPFGSLASSAVAWLIEHVGPLREGLDALAGDPMQITAFANTWSNVAKATAADAAILKSEAGKLDWTGLAGDAYRGHAAEHAGVLEAASKAAEGLSSGVMLAGTLVATVRMLVRDLIAQFVGKLAAWAAEAILTLGVGLIVVAEQAAVAVQAWAVRIANFLRKLSRSLQRLGELLNKLKAILGRLGDRLRSLPGARHLDDGKVTTERRLWFHHADGDPLRAHGSAFDTHPNEARAMMREAEELGVEIQWRDNGEMAYGPAPSPGRPGTMVLDRGASYGAWLHEMNHVRDDAEAGWLGMRGWYEDPHVRVANERRAYDVEIAYAKKIGDEAAAAELERLFQAERRRILGIEE